MIISHSSCIIRDKVNPMSERIPPTRFEQNKKVNLFVEAVARWHRKADVQGVENILKIKELLDEGFPVATFSNHLGHLDGPMIPTEFKNISPELRAAYAPVVGEVIWRNRLTRICMYAYSGSLMPSKRLKPKSDDAHGWELRERRKEAAHKAAAEDLANRKLLGLFPEASRSRHKGLTKVSPNISKYLYLVPNTYVVPVGFWGTEKVLPPDTKFIIPRFWNKPHMKVGSPISVPELEVRVGLSESKEENDQKLADELMYEVAQLLPEEYRGYYAQRSESRDHFPRQ